MAETKKFLDLTGLTRYDQNIKGHVSTVTGALNNLETSNKSNLVSAINETNSIAKGATVAISSNSYSSLITTFSSLDKNVYKLGQTVYVVTVDVPDLWISDVSNESNTYTYTTDAQVIEDIESGTFKVGYYTFSKLETGKVDLSEYVSTETLEETEEVVAHAFNDVSEKISQVSNDLHNIDYNTDIINKPPKQYVETSWQDLVTLRNNSQLNPGTWYRIVDYITTTMQEDTMSANHPFDIIVRADDVNILNENAYATQPKYQTDSGGGSGSGSGSGAGGGYFSNSKLEAWELKYCLDNDTSRFAWADTEDGKGVIYWMKDEFNNECPYDFKNILFKRWRCASVEAVSGKNPSSNLISDLSDSFTDGYILTSMSNMVVSNKTVSLVVDPNDYKFFFTFSVYQNGMSDDLSLSPDCFSNKIDRRMYPNVQSLNNNIIVCIDVDGDCYLNIFNSECYSNTIRGYSCYCNTFDSFCSSNTFSGGSDCYSNTFGRYCYSNTFGDDFAQNTFGSSCYSNTFGSSCYSNTFVGSCANNTFGRNCNNNTFGYSCYSNTFEMSCVLNTFGKGCQSNIFGNSCSYITFGTGCLYIRLGTSGVLKNYCRFIIVESGNRYIDLDCSATTSSTTQFQNVKIAQGVNNSSTPKTITHTTAGDTFQTIYKPINSVEVSV